MQQKTQLQTMGYTHLFANSFKITILADGHIGLTPCISLNNKTMGLQTIWMTSDILFSLQELLNNIKKQLMQQDTLDIMKTQ